MIEQRPVSNRDLTRHTVDRKATARIVNKAVAQNVANIDITEPDAVPTNRAIGGVLIHRYWRRSCERSSGPSLVFARGQREAVRRRRAAAVGRRHNYRDVADIAILRRPGLNVPVLPSNDSQSGKRRPVRQASPYRKARPSASTSLNEPDGISKLNPLSSDRHLITQGGRHGTGPSFEPVTVTVKRPVSVAPAASLTT